MVEEKAKEKPMAVAVVGVVAKSMGRALHERIFCSHCKPSGVNTSEKLKIISRPFKTLVFFEV